MTSASSWTTAIARVDTHDVTIRGYRLSDLVGSVSFVDTVFLVHTGELPSRAQHSVLDAIFVSLIEHGISPSTIITRQLVSCGTPAQAAIAGGVLSIADWHGGSGEELGRVLHEIVAARAGLAPTELDEALRADAAVHVAERRRAKARFEGFGHPQHVDGDPRARFLLDLAEQQQVSGPAVQLLHHLEVAIADALGRRLHANITGALAAILLDLGFSWRAIRGLVIMPRTAGLAAHVVEELDQGGTWRHASAEEVHYVGPTDRVLPNRDAADPIITEEGS